MRHISVIDQKQNPTKLELPQSSNIIPQTIPSDRKRKFYLEVINTIDEERGKKLKYIIPQLQRIFLHPNNRIDKKILLTILLFPLPLPQALLLQGRNPGGKGWIQWADDSSGLTKTGSADKLNGEYGGYEV